jgi:hypothetical protein
MAARIAGLARSQRRAVEEEAERMNPVNPKKELPDDRRPFSGLIRGSGATPSMGVSQIRGGRKGVSEAMRMGLHLGEHLHSLHGAGFMDDFSRGIEKAARDAPMTMAGEGRLGADGHGVRRGGALNSDTGAYHGKGTKKGMARKTAHLAYESESDEDMVGGGKLVCEHKEDGHGIEIKGGKKKRAPAKEGDGRRKRAEIVRRVMAEQGMKMIEASKYVKEHNLY